MVSVGVVGFGYWGPNIVRNIMSIEGMELPYIVDKNIDRLNVAKKLYPSITVTQDPNEILYNKRLNAIIIATPVSSHFELAYNALKSGKNVLLEKPLASSTHECLKLIDIADKKSLVLQVDHTFLLLEL